MRKRLRARDVGGKRIEILDQMIGGKQQQHRRSAEMFMCVQRREQDRWRGIASRRLEQEAHAIKFGARVACVFVAVEKIEIAPGDRQHIALGCNAQRAAQGLMQQRFAVLHAHERLGIGAARNGPQARAGAAGKNYR